MKKLLLVMACLTLALPLFAELKISYFSGTVEVFRNDQWQDAAKGMSLAVNDKVKTYDASFAVLVMDNNSRIWVKEDSEMHIISIGNESYFDLFFGKIRAKVEKLKSNKKFKIKTPVSVASIRGTELITSAEGELAVLEGNVAYSDVNEQNAIDVAQGFLGMIDAAGKLMAQQLTPEQLNAIQVEWEAIKDLGKGGDGQKTENQDEQKDTAKTDTLRQELRDLVNEVKVQIGEARELTNEIKEADLSTGRTLRDVHGNLVRVEQNMLRPDRSTIQILNITKRPEGYNYSNKTGWGYNGPAGSRLDVVDVKMKMNMPLPEQITEWPSFINSKGDSLHPETVLFRISNQTDEISNIGVWKLKGQPAEKTGDVTSEDRLVFTGTINGWTIDPNYTDTDPKYANVADQYKRTESADGSDSGDLWGWGVSPQFRIYKGSQEKFVRLGTEGYGINNDGTILNLNNFTNTSDNPFNVLKTIAGEQITFCREITDSSNYYGFADTAHNPDLFAKGNLDLIFTPDLIIAVAQKLANQISNLQKTNDTN
ncbi:MAG: FecR family protein [Elusimicrobia bacterium]|nr:FecR family protein [Candidatus Liberimonas magnetica]